MSKYRREDLREMAVRALAARDSADPRWTWLCIQIAVRLGISPNDVPRQIEELAR
mgnify:CR=1 FL=1